MDVGNVYEQIVSAINFVQIILNISMRRKIADDKHEIFRNKFSSKQIL